MSQNKADIVGITEVKPKNAMLNVQPSELQMENYQCFYSQEGRGTILYIRNGIGALALQVYPGNKEMDFGVVFN